METSMKNITAVQLVLLEHNRQSSNNKSFNRPDPETPEVINPWQAIPHNL